MPASSHMPPSHDPPSPVSLSRLVLRNRPPVAGGGRLPRCCHAPAADATHVSATTPAADAPPGNRSGDAPAPPARPDAPPPRPTPTEPCARPPRLWAFEGGVVAGVLGWGSMLQVRSLLQVRLLGVAAMLGSGCGLGGGVGGVLGWLSGGDMKDLRMANGKLSGERPLGAAAAAAAAAAASCASRSRSHSLLHTRSGSIAV